MTFSGKHKLFIGVKWVRFIKQLLCYFPLAIMRYIFCYWKPFLEKECSKMLKMCRIWKLGLTSLTLTFETVSCNDRKHAKWDNLILRLTKSFFALKANLKKCIINTYFWIMAQNLCLPDSKDAYASLPQTSVPPVRKISL